MNAFPLAQQFAQMGMVDSLVSSAGQMHHVGDHRLGRGVDRSAAPVTVCQGRCSFFLTGPRLGEPATGHATGPVRVR